MGDTFMQSENGKSDLNVGGRAAGEAAKGDLIIQMAAVGLQRLLFEGLWKKTFQMLKVN